MIEFFLLEMPLYFESMNFTATILLIKYSYIVISPCISVGVHFLFSTAYYILKHWSYISWPAIQLLLAVVIST